LGVKCGSDGKLPKAKPSSASRLDNAMPPIPLAMLLKNWRLVSAR